MHKYSRKIVVIGGGASGLYLTRTLSRLGYSVTLVDKANKLGGTCLHNSCVPSKAFIQCAQVAFDAMHAQKYGVLCDVKVNFEQIKTYIDEVINKIQKQDNPISFKSHGVDVIYGNAHFIGEHMLSVDDKLIPAEKFIIATGSRPSIPNIPGLTKIRYYTTDNILTIKELPKRLVIIGGGYAAFEYAQAFTRLGTEVTVLESEAEFLQGFDRAQIKTLVEKISYQGASFYSKVKINAVKEQDGEIFIEVSSGMEKFLHQKAPIKCDVLLVAAGRVPEVDNLGLELAGVDYNQNGIKVDDYLKTSRSHIFAIGDVVDSAYKFTHVSEYQAGIIIDNFAFKTHRCVNYKSVPFVMHTDPEFAQVGFTEQQLQAGKRSYKVIEYSFNKFDRAIISDQTEGSIKLLVKGDRLLGASILSPCAGELIHILSLAIKNRTPLKRIKDSIFAYPSWSQMHKRAVDKLYEPKLFGTFSKYYIKFRQWLE